ncbi:MULTISPECIES: 5-guanidino-2-oxopentanoate decarboxylase [unclassified Mycolicibacterium]|uniref:5-guanidino-2-oxopentanoate decarboxylase n=1 Tax=unclassified Mycolicibacterium TaxID=2636767 RepID=UPI002ED86FCF
MNFGHAISRLLAECGVDTVFGIPGVHTIELYRDFTSTGITPIIPRHEQGAGFMADGYARVTGQPGVCYLISGPGLLNAMTPIAQAWHDSIPMLIVSSAPPLHGRGPAQLHALPDQAGIVAQVTCISEEIHDPERFAELLAIAFDRWSVGRPRPVHLTVPVDVLAMQTGPLRLPTLRAARPPAPDQSDIGDAADLICRAERPVIIAGGGSRNAASQLRALAERIGAVVVTTGNARGILPDDHPLSVGTLLPFAPVLDYVEHADVVIAVGTKFAETDLIYTGSRMTLRGRVIRIDIDHSQVVCATPRSAVSLIADAALACEALTQAVTLRGLSPRTDTEATVRMLRHAVEPARAQTGLTEWLDVLARELPQDSIMAVDSTQLGYAAQQFLPWSNHRNWLAPYGFGTLGPSLPMALGAGVALPDRPAVALAGDGGILFTISELATAVDQGRQLTLIVWDNAGYGEIRDWFERSEVKPIGVDTTAHDLVRISEGFGATATRVTTPDELGAAIRRELTQPRTSVIVVDRRPPTVSHR